MEKLKSALGFLFKVIDQTDKALEDGKISFFDEAIPLGMNFINAPKFIQDLKESLPELKEVISDDIKKAEIQNYFTANFELSNEKAEKVVEAVFVAALNISDSIEDVVSAIKD